MTANLQCCWQDIRKMAPKYYHEDDAALIHASIHEIIKIWQKSSGQANLSLKIDNGLCELNLSVNLGQASSDPDTHVAGTNLPSNHNTSLLRKNGRKRKSPSQKDAGKVNTHTCLFPRYKSEQTWFRLPAKLTTCVLCICRVNSLLIWFVFRWKRY